MMAAESTDARRAQEDPFELSRFVLAQNGTYDNALRELNEGRKRSHWMWFVFPQLRGLGRSTMAQRYGITGESEAKAYLAHSILGPRLVAVSEAILAIEDSTATQVFGQPDDLKLRSCATLFASVSCDGSVFHRILDRYFDGESDTRSLALLSEH